MPQNRIMKNLFFLIATLISLNAAAQQSVEKSVNEFSTLKTFDLIEVNLIPSSENKVVISGTNPEDVSIVQTGKTLKIRMTLKKLFKGSDIEVNVFYTNIEVIDANEGSIITANNLIKQDKLELRTQEGATIDAHIEVDYLKIRAVTGGIIETRGEANTQDISIYTGGIYNGESLNTKTTTVSINAAGEANVRASQTVDARIRAGGNVYVYGNPKTITENIALGGNLKRM